MKQIIKLEKQDIEEAIELYLKQKGFTTVSIKLHMTAPFQSRDPRDSSTGTIRYECEVETKAS